MSRLYLAILPGTVCFGILFTLVASITFAFLTLRISALGIPGVLWCWWRYLFLLAPYPGDGRALAIAGGIGLLPIAVILLLPRRRDANGNRVIRRGTSGIHGLTNWMRMADAKALLPGNENGVQVVIGAAVRPDLTGAAATRFSFKAEEAHTWGPAPEAPLLMDRCENGSGSSLVVLAPGGGKTAAATTTIDRWGKSLFVLDPACELADLCRELQEDKGHTVYVLDPNGSTGFNALSWIDIADPLAEVNVRVQVARGYGKTSERAGQAAQAQQFFRDQGKNLVTCLLAHMLWHPNVPADAKTLRAVRGGLTVPQDELRDTLEGIYLDSESQLARDLAGPLFQMVPETFDGIMSNAQEGTAWLSVTPYADMVCGGDYDPAALCNGRTTVICQIPMKALDETPEIARVVVGSHLGAVFEAEGEVNGRVLFLLDEAILLGGMKALTTARDQGRKYRITLQLFYQSEGQAVETWGRDGWRAWCDAVTWRMYGTVSDLQTAKDLSATIGAFGAVAQSWGSNRGRSARMGEMGTASHGSNSNEHEVSKPLMHHFDLMRMRGDARVVLYRGELPIYCTAAFGYMRPDTKDRLGQNRYRRAYPRPGLRRAS